MIQKALLTIGITAFVLSANAQTAKKTTAKKIAPIAKTTVKPMTQLDSASYSFGMKIAQGLKSDGVTSLNYDLIKQAMHDVFTDQTLVVNDELAGKTIGQFLQKISKAKYAVAEEAGKKFLEDNKKNPKITTTASGLQYEVITMGTGVKPADTDTVTVHYKGSLVDGKQFDSSYDRGEPISLPLNGVIPGWTEGVQLMPVGSKFRFYIPYQLGYGERGAGQDIPPFSTLVFDIELMKIGS
ncbi:FKBP-type peptidyl-prolyl cis-trans isomerase [Pedobacter arcticus]|uniref:FKBP-type peptidyl-prolyl cis-trans isomerase n=1 Tax=Pedobacter arcticus TaxID=752140 RepID=UPI0002EDEDE0|nr:FKBP-type peptidyl-prolyl cis-trans isomerase [Pedobacter arcticus]